MYSTVILAMLGKIGAAAAFAVIYVWSAELYPTVVRNVGMGASSSCARVGGMLSPYIADLVSFPLYIWFLVLSPCYLFKISLIQQCIKKQITML